MNYTDLIARLRGEYRIPIMDGLGPAGGEEPDNPTEFVRRFEAPPIQHEAADALTVSQERIEVLEEALRGLLLVMPKQNYHCENDEPAIVLKARHIAGTAARAALLNDGGQNE